MSMTYSTSKFSNGVQTFTNPSQSCCDEEQRDLNEIISLL